MENIRNSMKKIISIAFLAVIPLAACLQSAVLLPEVKTMAAEIVNLEKNNVADGTGQQKDSDFVIDDKGVLVKYNGIAEVVIVPDGVLKIGKQVFWKNSVIQKVILPDSVTEIKKEAFSQCSNLTVVEGGNITQIGVSAFSRSSIQEIDLSKVEVIGDSAFSDSPIQEIDLSKVEVIGKSAFYGTSLKKLDLPKAKVIGDHAFEESLLEEVHLEEIEELGWRVFAQCKNLTIVTGLKHVQKIGGSMFAGTPFHDNYWKDEEKGSLWIENGVLLLGHHCIGKVVVPDGVTQIASTAFSGSKLEQIFLPDTVTEIGSNAFNCCPNLTTVRMEDSVINTGEYSIFSFCPALKDVRLSNSLTNIDYVFEYCYGLECLTLPASLKKLGANAFLHCKNLRTLTVPLEGLEEYANKINLVNYSLPLAQTVYVTDVSKAQKLEGAIKKSRTTVAELELATKKVCLGVGTKFALRFNSGAKAEEWKSSNKKVVITVDRVGNLYAKKAGTAIITATIYGKEYQCEVTVE